MMATTGRGHWMWFHRGRVVLLMVISLVLSVSAGVGSPVVAEETGATEGPVISEGVVDPPSGTQAVQSMDVSTSSPGTQVSAGGKHSCGLHEDGTVACWGNNTDGQATPPEGTFTSVSAGYEHTCAVRTDGTVACWGRDTYGQATPPTGTFTSVSAGNEHTCGLRTDGTAACWGRDNYGQATAAVGAFIAITAGATNSCGIRNGGTVHCWGNKTSGQSAPPSLSFESISLGADHGCGMLVDENTAVCWGAGYYGVALPGSFTSVSASIDHTCAVLTGGTVTCWGSNANGQSTPPTGEFTSVSAGYEHSCGVRTDGSVVCWGSGKSYRSTPPAGGFASVEAGWLHACGLRTDGTVACWGGDNWGQATPPAGSFTSISVLDSHTCGVRTDGAAVCWGYDGYGETTPPEGTFTFVSAGFSHSCGVRADGAAVCWGRDNYGQAAPPDGTFTSVAAGSEHTCGMRVDGTITCWGSNRLGQTTSPTGTFTSVSAGHFNTCGLRTDGTVACWGFNSSGEGTPPAGTFSSVSAGYMHTCGVRTDGTGACWGYDGYGQTTPPAGTFTSISAGNNHTCGLRTDGVFQCWGSDTVLGEPFGQVEGVVPAKPAKPAATAGDAQATVNWTAPSDGGSPVMSYRVRAVEDISKGCITTGASTCTVTGLTNGTAYTFKVRATNAVGDGAWSAASNAVTPTSSATAPAKPARPSAMAGDTQATVTWTAPSNGGSPITGYTVKSTPGNKTCTTTGVLTCTVTGLTNGTAYTFQVRATNAVGNSAWSAASDAVTPSPATPSGATYYHPISPTRLIDPRPAWKVGPFSTPWTNGLARDVQVAGQAGIPVDAKAVVLNVTVTDVTSPGGTFISVYPKGATRPNVSSLNAASGQTIANSVTTKIGDGGQITIYNDQGSANVIVDVAGYYTEGSGDVYTALSPTRVIDSRSTWQVGPYSTPWNAAQSRDVTIDTAAGVPSGADAVVLNVTATDVTQGTFISVYPKGTTRPNASNLNLAAGNTIANQVVVKLGTANQISVYNEVGKANVIVDVVGYYASGSGDAFYPVAPERIIDPRPPWKVGPFSTPWGNQQTRVVQVANNAGVPPGAKAVVMNVTATDVTSPAGTFMTVFPGGTVPNASNLNASSGWTIANAVTAKLSSDGKVSVYNEKPTANIIVDVNGYFG